MSKPIDLNKLIAEPTADDDLMVSRVVASNTPSLIASGPSWKVCVRR